MRILFHFPINVKVRLMSLISRNTLKEGSILCLELGNEDMVNHGQSCREIFSGIFTIFFLVGSFMLQNNIAFLLWDIGKKETIVNLAIFLLFFRSNQP